MNPVERGRKSRPDLCAVEIHSQQRLDEFAREDALPPDEMAGVKVWTGAGANDAENLFWGRRAAVWNNAGDTAVLSDRQGAQVARYAY